MKNFLYRVVVLLSFLPLYGAAQVGFNRVGFFSNVPNNSKKYYAVAIDSQGRIITVGTTDLDDGLIARYLPNGTLDTTFNGTGFINTEGMTNSFYYRSFTLDLQGRIIVVGHTDDDNGLIVRYLANGVLDAESNWNTNNYRESANINNISIGLLG